MLKHQQTYEIMRPETVGATHARIVLGKHSGRHAFAVRLAELGYSLEARELDEAFSRFKALGDKKRSISDADLESLMASELTTGGAFQLEGLQVSCGTAALPTATVKLRGADGEIACAGLGRHRSRSTPASRRSG